MSEKKFYWMDNFDNNSTDKVQPLIYQSDNGDNLTSENTIGSNLKSTGDIETNDYINYQKSNIANYILKQNEFLTVSYYNNIDDWKTVNGKISQEKMNKQVDNENNNGIETSQYQCNDCMKSFDLAKLLDKHIFYRHTGIKRHKCRECEYATNNLSHLKRHIYTHNNQLIIHKCSHCEFTCDSSRSLKKHNYTHASIRPYKCLHCDYASMTLNHLTRHKLIHSDVRPHKCPHCHYVSARSDHLKKHIQRIHSS
ncbi:zinc finger protein 286A [Microplitis demolitor]|uniref:zinc finger protein 286A n=1 Tax=Microplitis demolitor TaxID=69319 RepID=UPI0004CD0BF0|nr:zinc finger protein 286A [Microplitis demolitor]